MKRLINIISIFSTLHVAGQHVIIPAAHSKYRIEYQKHKGYIQLNNGEKISGIYQYAFWEFPSYNIKSFTEKGALIKRYRSRDIKSIVLAGSDRTLSNKDSTYFMVLDKSKALYRQLTFGSIEVFDYFFNVNEARGLIYTLLIVKANDQLHTFKSESKFIKWLKANYPDKIRWNDNITSQEIVKQLNGIH